LNGFVLDPETPVRGVTTGDPILEVQGVAVLQATGEQPDFELVGWGYLGRGNAVMPSGGKVEPAADGLDVYLNDTTYWHNVPKAVWAYTLGGYQVLKKWLSYRDMRVLERPLAGDEVRTFMHIARRIAALIAMEAALNENYELIKLTDSSFSMQ
jgi:hypothetical protein